MTNDELRAEVRAIVDLHQRLGDHIARRLHRHLNAKPGGGKTDYRLTMGEPRQWPFRTCDDEDDGSD